MYRLLAQTYPDAHVELDFQTPYQLLVATVIAAQTTDIAVNKITPELFARYPTPAALAGANPDDLERIIHSLGFFRAKTRSLLGLANALVERFNGEVPNKLSDLVTLPGVGRKTANVVLGSAFGIPGITVDTHFGRLSRRFGWTTATNPDQVEKDVGELFEKKDWILLSQLLIWHGRRVCFARKPNCWDCSIATLCPSYGSGPTLPPER